MLEKQPLRLSVLARDKTFEVFCMKMRSTSMKILACATENFEEPHTARAAQQAETQGISEEDAFPKSVGIKYELDRQKRMR